VSAEGRVLHVCVCVCVCVWYCTRYTVYLGVCVVLYTVHSVPRYVDSVNEEIGSGRDWETE